MLTLLCCNFFSLFFCCNFQLRKSHYFARQCAAVSGNKQIGGSRVGRAAAGRWWWGWERHPHDESRTISAVKCTPLPCSNVQSELFGNGSHSSPSYSCRAVSPEQCTSHQSGVRCDLQWQPPNCGDYADGRTSNFHEDPQTVTGSSFLTFHQHGESQSAAHASEHIHAQNGYAQNYFPVFRITSIISIGNVQ